MRKECFHAGNKDYVKEKVKGLELKNINLGRMLGFQCMMSILHRACPERSRTGRNPFVDEYLDSYHCLAMSDNLS